MQPQGENGERPGPELSRQTYARLRYGGRGGPGMGPKGYRRAAQGDLISRDQSGPAIASDCQ